MLLLAVEQVLAVRQSERVHHVCYVREELLHFSQTGIRPVVEERVAPGGPGQGNIFMLNYDYYLLLYIKDGYLSVLSYTNIICFIFV